MSVVQASLMMMMSLFRRAVVTFCLVYNGIIKLICYRSPRRGLKISEGTLLIKTILALFVGANKAFLRHKRWSPFIALSFCRHQGSFSLSLWCPATSSYVFIVTKSPVKDETLSCLVHSSLGGEKERLSKQQWKRNKQVPLVELICINI